MAVGSAETNFIFPDWPAPFRVRAAVTTRAGGCSKGGYAGCNIADHVGDEPQSVLSNRAQIAAALELPAAPRWLQQVHSPNVVCADSVTAPISADASWTTQTGVVCAVMTADCLPILMCDRQGSMVAAVHAGWRGMSAGVIAETISCFAAAGIAAHDVVVWLGPAIGPANYEVDRKVHDAFATRQPHGLAGFADARPGHWNLDLYVAARELLNHLSVVNISGGDFCTYRDPRFFSYRRASVSGRMAALIWLD